MTMPFAAALALALPCLLIAPCSSAALTSHQLNNGVVEAKITQDIGGRLLSFGLRGGANFLRASETGGSAAIGAVNAFTGHVPYNGHEIWVGPQSQWWAHQKRNPQRAASKAIWPPDPYLSLAPYTVLEQSARSIALESLPSEVSGLQLRKRYSLVADKPNSLEHTVSATNRRAVPVAWDIWFNTRVHSGTRVYVPVASAADVRVKKVSGMHGAPLSHTLDAGIFSLDLVAPPPGQKTRQGKVLLQPSHGWLAGFHGEQAFIIQFAHQPRAAIHPEQGQVELFADYQPADMDKGLVEMEVHAPYVTLAPGQTMQAGELWTIVSYKGEATRAAHIAFLREQAGKLGLTGL